MFIIDVIPLTKIPLDRSQVYTYFYPQKISVGVLVIVSLYKRKTPGLVVKVQKLEKRKIEIKKFPYKLKEIEKIISSQPIFTEKQLFLIRWLADYYHAPLSLIAKIISPPILKREREIFQPKKVKLKLKKTLKLTSQAKKIISDIQKTKKNIILIKADSDKTREIYPKIIESIIKKKKQVLILCSEISKTNELKEFLESYFDKFLIDSFHSKTAQGKFLQIYKKIKQNKTKIIIAARLGVFAPFDNLGLVIVNQEENPNYKSQKKFPYYQGRDVALKLSKIFKAKVILASETPSIKSFYKAQKNEYKLIKPIADCRLPIASLVDMRQEIRKGNFSIFSEEILENLKKNLKQKKKSLLFVSRRGMATFVVCQDCGYVIRCPKCDAPMVYHAEEKNSSSESDKKTNLESELLICHHCNFRAAPPPFCSRCQGHRIKYSGTGTQKVERKLKEIFPQAKIVRLDSDTIKNIKTKKEIYKDFKNGKIDILVATQIILGNKDLDKTDIGVISIDTILHLPDFRAAERTFQLVYQLIKMSDYFILQTYSSRNFSFQSAIRMDYETFYKKEIEERKTLGYPPFSRLIKLTCFNRDSDKGEKEARQIVDSLNQTKKRLLLSDKQLIILGPAPAFIPRVRGQWKWNIILKIKKENKKTKKELLKLVPQNWLIDVDPENLL